MFYAFWANMNCVRYNNEFSSETYDTISLTSSYLVVLCFPMGDLFSFSFDINSIFLNSDAAFGFKYNL